MRLEDGALAIASFPHGQVGWNVIAREATALDLLQAAGISAPRRRLTQAGDRSVLLLRRFDRGEQGLRIGYISAMTTLGADDGDHRDYAEIAGAIRDLSRSPRRDHRELFDQVVASVALGNTDDNLRHHGFLRDHGAWSLSPALDVNPNPEQPRARTTGVTEAEHMPEEAGALIDLAPE